MRWWAAPTHHPHSSALLLGLLWLIGGSPPVLRGARALQGGGALATLALLLAGLLVPAEGRPAPAPWCGQELSQQVLGADMVVRGSVVSRSRVEGGRYWATFRVDKLLHSVDGSRVQFLRVGLGVRGGPCAIAAKVRPSGRYLVMVKKQGEAQAQFSLSSPPVKSTKKLVREVKRILSGEEKRQKVRVRRGKVQPPPPPREESTPPPPREESTPPPPRVQQTTRLSCSARGNPPPTLYWTIDGRVIANSHHTRIVTKKLSKFLRKSVLRLRGGVQRSSTHLQCHAFNSYGHTSKVKMGKMRTSQTREEQRSQKKRKKQKTMRRDSLKSGRRNLRVQDVGGRRVQEGLRGFRATSSALKGSRLLGPSLSPLLSSTCPIPDFCLNGGTCQFYSALGEQTCQCAKGYRGKRCERKYVSTGNLGPHMSDRFPLCLLGMAHYPCQ